MVHTPVARLQCSKGKNKQVYPLLVALSCDFQHIGLLLMLSYRVSLLKSISVVDIKVGPLLFVKLQLHFIRWGHHMDDVPSPDFCDLVEL